MNNSFVYVIQILNFITIQTIIVIILLLQLEIYNFSMYDIRSISIHRFAQFYEHPVF